jgi:DNA-binding CsgD family transcriptional regulator
MTADPHDPDVLRKLADMSRALASHGREVMGLTAGDLWAEGWLGYHDAATRGLNHAGCMVRARGAMLDVMRTWDGSVWDREQKCRSVSLVSPNMREFVASTPTHRTRARLSRQVRQSLDRLLPREKYVLRLLVLRGWPPELVAERLQCSTNAVWMLRHRALHRLRVAAGVSSDKRRKRN